MKRLIVSLKSADEILDDFKGFLRKAKRGKVKKPHYEISFDNKKDFDRFVRNIFILKYILIFKPRSIYELAKITKIDVSNLNKIILFFEEVGALKVESTKVSGRLVKRPVVEYDTIEFNLAA
jgi:predicted transcriptional regulator